ncbi:MAG: L,D-transpeptidase family protein [Sphingobacteriales bacterium JAD_PAG50586_3]|nr:MAG: L,D-transpeptidase family protein [Sphingobacteriales bacterium JAD_PAG50586_3]
MRRFLLLISAPLLLSACGNGQTTPAPTQCNPTSGTFKTAQLKNIRVKEAYDEKEGSLLKLLNDKGICPENLELYIRAFKADKKLEVWAKNKQDKAFKLFKVYDICQSSGKLGPKRKDGDRQVPEGFYHINDFNPNSRFHLSLGINYPNKADLIMGDEHPGNEIYIHGDCVTIGCMPLTDEIIKELYVLCIEAKTAGQTNIPVHIFPSKLIGKPDGIGGFSGIYKPLIPFWKSLKPAYDYFEKHKKLPVITIDSEGNYVVS